VSTGAVDWSSDAVARLLADLDIGLVSYVPGSTLRGLLETLSAPTAFPFPVVQCLHESAAVAVAHGFAKTSGKVAVVLLHSSVGLLNAAMAIYNAALDFAPIVLVVGTAPQRLERRRPWIDRIHAGQELADLSAHLVKRTAITASVDEALDELVAGTRSASELPTGPVAIFVDREVFEEPTAERTVGSRHRDTAGTSMRPPSAEAVEAMLSELAAASHPLVLAGRLGLNGWNQRVELAELAALRVLTDLRLPGTFPTAHPAYAGGLDVQGRAFGDADIALREADVVLALEWADPRTASAVGGWAASPPRMLFDVRLDDFISAPVAARAEAFPVAHRRVQAAGQETIAMLLERIDRARRTKTTGARHAAKPRASDLDGPLSLEAAAVLLRDAAADQPTTLVKVPVEWQASWWPITDPRSYLGYDGGGGLGSGPGLLVGAAIAVGSERLALAVLGDGDVLMGAHALWSAAVAAVAPLLIVVDNEGYANEARHMEKIAAERGRASKWEQHTFPFRLHPADIGGIARAFGMHVLGPAEDVEGARELIAQGVRAARGKAATLVHLKIHNP
jgi:thiamine pyrophosphate-dependent acetolactate synthase large subunit-like protein